MCNSFKTIYFYKELERDLKLNFIENTFTNQLKTDTFNNVNGYWENIFYIGSFIIRKNAYLLKNEVKLVINFFLTFGTKHTSALIF